MRVMANQDQSNTPVNSSLNGTVANQPISGGLSKEVDMPRVSEPIIQEVKEYEVPKEVSSHVTKVQENIEIPPDLKNIGVAQPHSHGKVSDVLQKEIKLPLSDDQIGIGLQADTKSSLRWLAEWCLKQLKNFHLTLIKVGQHFVRFKNTKK